MNELEQRMVILEKRLRHYHQLLVGILLVAIISLVLALCLPSVVAQPLPPAAKGDRVAAVTWNNMIRSNDYIKDWRRRYDEGFRTKAAISDPNGNIIIFMER